MFTYCCCAGASKLQSSSCPLALETWLSESLRLGRPCSEGWPGVGRPGWMPEPIELGRPGSEGWPGVGRSGWMPEPIELESSGFGGVPGVGRPGERPEFGLCRMTAGL